MRILFATLVILNIAFFAWQYAQDDSEGSGIRSAATNDDGVPSLVLLSEREAPEAQENKQSRAEQNERKAGSATCYSVGPFQDRLQAEKLAANTRLSGIQSRIDEESTNQRSGYWVRWPEELMLAEARSVMGELKGKGITDLTITPMDNKRYAISLGIFSSRHYMELRVDEMIALGYTPVVEDRYKNVINYWLRMKISNTAIMDKLNPLAQQIPGVKVLSVACQ